MIEQEEVKKAVNPPEAMKPTDASAAAKVTGGSPRGPLFRTFGAHWNGI